MKKYGLIGYPLSHSFSPKYFADKFESLQISDAEYKAYPIEKVEDIKKLIAQGVIGFNVTIPYKEQIIPLLDVVSIEALEIGAVNTVKYSDGKLYGYNTDVFGLENSLIELLGETGIERALVLGTGGAAKATVYVLNKLDIQATVVTRNLDSEMANKGFISYEDIYENVIKDHLLIINTTPLGMYPDIENCPNIPYEYIDERFFAFDLVYNPKKTLFLTRIENQGGVVKNGLQMLHDQADKAWQIWNQ